MRSFAYQRLPATITEKNQQQGGVHMPTPNAPVKVGKGLGGNGPTWLCDLTKATA